MAYEGRNPEIDSIQMKARSTTPPFPGTATDTEKEGTLFVSNDSTGTGAYSPPGLYVYQRNSTGTSFSWQVVTPNTNASQIISGNLGAEFGGVPCGTIIAFAKNVQNSPTGLPTGYLLCDGSFISKTTYATLYAAMGGAGNGSTGTGGGDAYGVSGTNFALPDMRGVFMRGRTGTAGDDPDASTRTAAATGGATGNNVGSIQADALEHHSHYTHNSSTNSQGKWGPLSITSGDYADSGNGNNADEYWRMIGNSTVPAYGKTAPSTFPTGNFSATDTRPKNLYFDFLIRYL